MKILGAQFDMRDEVSTTYRDFSTRWPRVALHFWNGKPHEMDDLVSHRCGLEQRAAIALSACHSSNQPFAPGGGKERVSVAAARHIVVLGASR